MQSSAQQRRGTVLSVPLLVLGMVVVAIAAFFAPGNDLGPADPGLASSWWVLAPLFALTDLLVVHRPLARSAHTHTLWEVPAVLALALTSPTDHLLANLIGSGCVLLFVQRQSGVKLVFNLALYGVQCTVGVLIYRLILDGARPAEVRGWVAAVVAILLIDLVAAALITLVIYLAGDGFSADVLRQAVGSGAVAGVANAMLALLIVIVVAAEPTALLLLTSVLITLFLTYLGYVRLAKRYSQMNLLYRFVQSVEGSATRSVEDTVKGVLTEARDLLRAGRAEFIEIGPNGSGVRLALLEDGSAVRSDVTTTADPWWAAAAGGEAVLEARAPKPGRGIGARLPGDLTDAMAAPVSVNGSVLGVLVVANRLFEGETFSAEDLRLFQTMVGHAAATLNGARLMHELRREAAERDHEARHDALTGLPNRRELQTAIESVSTDGGSAALLLFDVNDFKEVNDTLGHPAGDELIKEIGRRLNDAADGLVARLGGDEFAVLLTGSTERAVSAAETLLEVVQLPVPVDGVDLLVRASVGVALIPEHGLTSAEVLAHADVAMYLAKASQGAVQLFVPEDEAGRHRRLVLAGEMADAIESGQIVAYYQPKAAARTGEVVAVEALVRWEHPQYGLVSPLDVLPVAERTGLIRRLTDHMLASALHQRARWAAEGIDLAVAVNVTTHDLLDPGLPDVVARLLAETGTRPEELTIEIVESGLMDQPEQCLTVMHRLAACGVHLSVDDFGTGYSSLSYLERLPVHEVKIDRSFVVRLEDPAYDPIVVMSTTGMGHALGLQVVAEGVETRAVWDRLADIGVDSIQGYHLSKPLPAAEIAAAVHRTAADTKARAATPSL